MTMELMELKEGDIVKIRTPYGERKGKVLTVCPVAVILFVFTGTTSDWQTHEVRKDFSKITLDVGEVKRIEFIDKEAWIAEIDAFYSRALAYVEELGKQDAGNK